MKKYSVIFLFAAMGLLAGCVKENAPEAPEAGKATLDVSITPVSKTYMGEAEAGKRKVYWAEGDAINVNGNDSQPLESTAAGTQKATFHFDTPVSAPFNLFYPAGIATDPTHVTLPAIQTYKADSFADGMFPMAGYSADGSSIALKHLCAVMKVNVKRSSEAAADEDRLVAVSFQGKSDEQVSGSFAVDFAAATLTGASSAEADKVVRVNKVLVTSTTEAVSYYVVVPAIEYAAGFKLVIQDESAHTMTLNVGAKTLEAGKLYDLTEATFTPNGSVDGIEIASAQDLIDFATAYNAKTYEALGGALVVEVVDNITFDPTTSAAFNATGGIGLKKMNGDAEDYYFSGSFKGNDHTISGLEATVPIFKATEDDGIVKDLTISSTCSFTFTHPNANEIFFGSVVGYHKGLLENVSVAADVALEPVADVEYMTSLGGLVGRATVGQLEGCEYAGLISTPAGFTATPPADDPNTRKLIIGGLVGRFSNAGSLSGSYFKGAISNEAQIGTGDAGNDYLKSNPFIIIGGAVGYVGGGATVSSTHTTVTHATVDGVYGTTAGIIVHKSATAFHSAIGGIVGEVNKGTVSSCTNGASIQVSVIRLTDDNAVARYIKTGGIAGMNDSNGIINGCTNNGTIQHNSNSRIQYAGGIAGSNAGKIEGDKSVNNATITFETTGVDPIYGARIPYIGGIIGENASTHVSNVENNGDIYLKRTEMGNTAYRVCLGGIIALTSKAIDGGTSKSIVNNGRVEYNTNNNKITTETGYCMGGVIGYSSASVQNVKNNGYVRYVWSHASRVVQKAFIGGILGYMAGSGSVSGCVNGGQVYFNLTNGGAHTGNCLGGILGTNKDGTNVAISGCQNTALINTSNYTAEGKTLYLGGIVGSLTGASSISDCHNTGRTNVNGTNNIDDDKTALFADGGIAGYVEGTAENRISISNCDWINTSETAGARRGTCGGIVAYAEYADVSNCEVNVTYNVYNHVTGGVVGWAVNSNITGSIFRGSKIAATQAYVNGGIVAKLHSGSVVDGCYNYCKDITTAKAATVRGEIAAVSETGTTIQNCHHTGTIGICSDDHFTDGGGNVADL